MDHHYFVMDYISGQPLELWMASGQRSIEEKPSTCFASISSSNLACSHLAARALTIIVLDNDLPVLQETGVAMPASVSLVGMLPSRFVASVDSAGILTYEWDFDNDGLFTSPDGTKVTGDAVRFRPEFTSPEPGPVAQLQDANDASMVGQINQARVNAANLETLTMGRIGVVPRAPDYDYDGDVDSDDVIAFANCAFGPAITLIPGCQDRDFDKDSDVDQSDFGIFQVCYSGAGRPADPNCAN